jgi:hypothetical protein
MTNCDTKDAVGRESVGFRVVVRGRSADPRFRPRIAIGGVDVGGGNPFGKTITKPSTRDLSYRTRGQSFRLSVGVVLRQLQHLGTDPRLHGSL